MVLMITRVGMTFRHLMNIKKFLKCCPLAAETEAQEPQDPIYLIANVYGRLNLSLVRAKGSPYEASS